MRKSMDRDINQVFLNLEFDREVSDELLSMLGKQHTENKTDKWNPLFHRVKRLFK